MVVLVVQVIRQQLLIEVVDVGQHICRVEEKKREVEESSHGQEEEKRF